MGRVAKTFRKRGTAERASAAMEGNAGDDHTSFIALSERGNLEWSKERAGPEGAHLTDPVYRRANRGATCYGAFLGTPLSHRIVSGHDLHVRGAVRSLGSARFPSSASGNSC